MRLTFALFLALALAVAGPLAGQTPLFQSVGPNSVSGTPAPGIVAVYPITVAFDDLALAPAQLAVELPEVGTITADLRVFEGKEGFDAPGVPTPGTTIEDLRYVWRGQGEGYDVIVAVAYGWPSATIVGPGGEFTFWPDINSATQTLNTQTLVELAPLPYPDEPPLPDLPPFALASSPQAPPVLSTDLVPGAGVRRPAPGKWLPETQVLRVLFVYTDQARIDVGGGIIIYKGDPVLSIIDNALAESNQMFENSDANIKLELAGAALLYGFVPTGNADEDLKALRTDANIRQWRTLFEADLVSAFLRKGVNPSYCGFAYTQRPGCGDFEPIGGCNPGAAFYDYAIHWTDITCARDQRSVPHEVGHNFGLEHSLEDLPPWFGRDRAIFFDAFGYLDTVNDFQTAMGVQPYITRLLQLSNPNVFWTGFPTGILDDRFNARVAEVTVVEMVDFDKVIFIAGFESGTTEEWN